MSDQKVGILNALNVISTPKMAEQITEHVVAVGVNEVSQESLMAIDGVTEAAAIRVVAALDLHKTLSTIKVRKQREKKPSVAERYQANTSEDERADMAVKVAELRINEEGTKPLAWRTIREHLGLKNEEFHKVIRLSDTWKEVVIQRIKHLKEQEGGWEYNGKIEVLTGIEGFDMSEVDNYVEQQEEVVDNVVSE